MLYPKIDTLFERDENHKVIEGKIRNPIFNLIKKWEFTEKLDGTNIRIEYEPSLSELKINYGGRTESAQLPTGIVNYLNKFYWEDKLLSIFGDKKVTLFGEGIGPNIQNGGLYCETQQVVIFDICVDEKYWLTIDSIKEICNKIGIRHIVRIKEYSLDEVIDLVKNGFRSCFFWKEPMSSDHPMSEGIIGKTNPPIFDNQGKRIMFKLKTKDFK